MNEGTSMNKQFADTAHPGALHSTGDNAFSDLQNIFIELTSRCNMECKFCPYPVLKRKKQDMPHEYVLKILEEVKGMNNDVTFHVLGEPLLNKRFFEYASLCDDYGISYWLVTNGLTLTPDVSDRLFSLKNLKNLEISFHTMTEKDFALRCCRISFKNYMQKIHDTIFSQKRYDSDVKINIDVMYDLHLFEGNIWNSFSLKKWQSFTSLMLDWGKMLNEQHPDARTRWPRFFESKKKVFHREDHYLFRQFSDIPATLFEALPPHITWIRWEVFPNVFVSLKKFFFFTKNDAYLQHALGTNTHAVVTPASNFSCSWPCHLAILSNGDITFCCLDYEGELACGNIQHMTLAEAAQSRIRRQVMSRPDTFALCRQCKGEMHLN